MIKTVEIPCPLCRSASARPWARENGFAAVKCEECGLTYVNPRPTRDATTEANIIGQHRTAHGVIDIVFKRKPCRIKRYRRTFSSMFADRLHQPLRWLDVGAGYGEVVEALSSLCAEGSRIEGIEPMLQKARVAQDRGLPIRACALSDVEDRYDVVSIVDVFSHIPDFHEFLAAIRDHLLPDGELFVQTGNGGDLHDAGEYPDLLYLPDHLVFAGVEHIRRFLAHGGFELVSTRAARVDTFTNAARDAVRRTLGKAARLYVPYASSFRTVSYRARLTGG